MMYNTMHNFSNPFIYTSINSYDLCTPHFQTVLFDQSTGMETEDAVDEIDGTVHSASSGTAYRHGADSSIESCNMSVQNINDSVQSVYDNGKTRNSNNNNDYYDDNSISNNCDNSHNSNNNNNNNNNNDNNNDNNENNNNDDHGIVESGAVCVDEQPHMITKNNKLDAENNLSAKYCENSEVDDVFEIRKINNTVLVKDNISENWDDKNEDVVVCVNKTQNNNKTSHSVSKQK